MQFKRAVVGLAVVSLVAISGCGASLSQSASGFPLLGTIGYAKGGSGRGAHAPAGYSKLVFSDNFSGTSLDSN